MKKHRIMLMFDHPGCPDDVVIDVHLPLADPIEDSLEAVAERVRPTCPICKAHMRYSAWSPDHTFHDDRDAENSQ